MSVAVTYQSKCTVRETIEANDASLGDPVVTHNGFDTVDALNAASTPPATKVAAFEALLTDGSGSIDLAALVGTNGAVVDGTGLKVQVLKLKAKSTNANVITIDVGETNGYALLGAAFSVALLAGQEVLIYGNEATPDVASGAKVLDLVGTGVQGLDVIVVLG